MRLGADYIPVNTLCLGAGSNRGLDYLQQEVNNSNCSMAGWQLMLPSELTIDNSLHRLLQQQSCFLLQKNKLPLSQY